MPDVPNEVLKDAELAGLVAELPRVWWWRALAPVGRLVLRTMGRPR